ncbi:MAG: glycosyltransferase [Candidatus Sericytochromatia bacterium]|nr:glycosyltransferase [Candidatus Sericytochromatia bacterium]
MPAPSASPAVRSLVAIPLVAFAAIGALGFWFHSYAPLQLSTLLPVVYGLVVFSLGAWFYGRPAEAEAALAIDDSELPLVSVLIPAHNEEAVIANTLEHVLRLDYPRFEVLVIDDHSHDRTSEVVSQFPGVLLVQRRNLPNRGKSEALNAGLEFASGAVICVFDADTEMAPDFLRKAVAPLMNDPTVCGVQAQVRIYNRRENLLAHCQDDEFALFNEILQTGRTRLGLAAALGGNGQLTRRSAVEAVGGWNPGSLTEDLDLTMRLLLAGCGRIYHVTEAVVWQEGVTTMSGLIRQRQRWAEGMLRSYADYVAATVKSPQLTLGMRADAVYVLLSCFFPLMTVLGLMFQLASYVPGAITHALPYHFGDALSFVIIGFSVVWSLTISWKRERRLDVLPGLRYLVYLLHWVPALMVAVRNVLTDRKVVWAKTEHRGHVGAFAPRPSLPSPPVPVRQEA